MKDYQHKHYLTHREEKNKICAEWRANYRKITGEFMKEAKSKPCTDCKKIYHPICMDFDHRNPREKSESISMLIHRRFNLEVIKREMAKCDLVCANCHRLRTLKQTKNYYTDCV